MFGYPFKKFEDLLDDTLPLLHGFIVQFQHRSHHSFFVCNIFILLLSAKTPTNISEIYFSICSTLLSFPCHSVCIHASCHTNSTSLYACVSTLASEFHALCCLQFSSRISTRGRWNFQQSQC